MKSLQKAENSPGSIRTINYFFKFCHETEPSSLEKQSLNCFIISLAIAESSLWAANSKQPISLIAISPFTRKKLPLESS